MRKRSYGGNKPRVLDLFCCAGGASKGYHDAGFDVVGVDIDPQPHYPFKFFCEDALAVLERLLRGGSLGTYVLTDFDAIHASPPCQAFTHAQRIRDNEHPDLVAPTRVLLEEIGLPYVIENVPGAPLINPITLCGAMFPPLRTYRHRLFETNFPLPQPPEPPHVAPQVKMGRPAQEGEWIQVVGNFSGVAYAKKAMGIDWMVRDELKEAIPPAYAEWVGRFLFAAVQQYRRRPPKVGAHALALVA